MYCTCISMILLTGPRPENPVQYDVQNSRIHCPPKRGSPNVQIVVVHAKEIFFLAICSGLSTQIMRRRRSLLLFFFPFFLHGILAALLVLAAILKGRPH